MGVSIGGAFIVTENADAEHCSAVEVARKTGRRSDWMKAALAAGKLALAWERLRDAVSLHAKATDQEVTCSYAGSTVNHKDLALIAISGLKEARESAGQWMLEAVRATEE